MQQTQSHEVQADPEFSMWWETFNFSSWVECVGYQAPLEINPSWHSGFLNCL